MFRRDEEEGSPTAMAPQKSHRTRIAIIDVYNHLHRFHHKIESTDPSAPPGALVVAFGKMIASLISYANLNRAIAVFDPLHTEPKPGRKETPQRIVQAVPLLIETLKDLSVPSVVPLFNEEGDQLIADLVGAIARDLPDADTYIISSDKDLAQLVSSDPAVTLVRWEDHSWSFYAPATVQKRWGVRPEQIPHWLALVGDSVDGIEGTPGIGEKTASKLLTRWGDIYHLVSAASGLSLTEATDRLHHEEEIECSQVEGLTKKLASNLSGDTPNFHKRLQQTLLLPRRMDVPAPIKPPPGAFERICRAGLTVMSASIMNGTLWKK